MRSGEEWDEDESYPVAEVLKQEFPSLQFQKMSSVPGYFLFRVRVQRHKLFPKKHKRHEPDFTYAQMRNKKKHGGNWP